MVVGFVNLGAAPIRCLNRSSFLCKASHEPYQPLLRRSRVWIKPKAPSQVKYPDEVTRQITAAISVTTEALPGSQVALSITVTKEDCSSAWNKVLRKLGKEVDVSGFRKGKAPQQIIVNMLGRNNVKAEACQELMEKCVDKALKEYDIQSIGQARFEDDESAQRIVDQFEPDQDLSFRVRIDVWPDVKFTGPYEGLEVEATEVPIDEDLVDQSLQELRKRESFTVLAPEGSTAQVGQVAISSLVGYYRKEDGSKGERLPDIAGGEDIEVILEEKQYMPGFIEGLIGMKVGETRTIPVQFPEQSAKVELRGVNALFDVTINALKDKVLPELNDEFAKKATESETLEDLKKVIKARLGIETEAATTQNVNTAIENALLELVETELPDTLVENQMQSKFATMMTEFKSKGMSDDQVKKLVTKDNYEMYKKTSGKTVERRLKINLAFTKIAKEQGLESSEDEIQDQMEVIKAELKAEEFDEKRVREHIAGELERDKVLAFLKESWKVTMVPPKEEEDSKQEDAKVPIETTAVAG